MVGAQLVAVWVRRKFLMNPLWFSPDTIRSLAYGETVGDKGM